MLVQTTLAYVERMYREINENVMGEKRQPIESNLPRSQSITQYRFTKKATYNLYYGASPSKKCERLFARIYR